MRITKPKPDTQQSTSRWGVLCLKWDTLTLISLLLPVTCYRRVETMSCLRYAFVVPSLCLRFRFAPIDGASTDLQRIYNGPTTELHRRDSRAFFASFPRFLCGVNEFGMLSTKSGLCKPFRENNSFSTIMSTTCCIITTKTVNRNRGKTRWICPQINAYCCVIETVSRLYPTLQFTLTVSLSLP